jgi:hypothetical protein
VYSHVIGDSISWKPGKNLVEQAKLAQGKQADDEEEEEESFFAFFSPHPSIIVPESQLPSRPAKAEGGNDKNADDDDERDMLIEDDFDMGEALKDRVYPFSLLFDTKLTYVSVLRLSPTRWSISPARQRTTRMMTWMTMRNKLPLTMYLYDQQKIVGNTSIDRITTDHNQLIWAMDSWLVSSELHTCMLQRQDAAIFIITDGLHYY